VEAAALVPPEAPAAVVLVVVVLVVGLGVAEAPAAPELGTVRGGAPADVSEAGEPPPPQAARRAQRAISTASRAGVLAVTATSSD